MLLIWLDLTWLDLIWLDLTWLDWLDLIWLTWLDLTWSAWVSAWVQGSRVSVGVFLCGIHLLQHIGTFPRVSNLSPVHSCMLTWFAWLGVCMSARVRGVYMRKSVGVLYLCGIHLLQQTDTFPRVSYLWPVHSHLCRWLWLVTRFGYTILFKSCRSSCDLTWFDMIWLHVMMRFDYMIVMVTSWWWIPRWKLLWLLIWIQQKWWFAWQVLSRFRFEHLRPQVLCTCSRL